jgi:hypothetical protein
VAADDRAVPLMLLADYFTGVRAIRRTLVAAISPIVVPLARAERTPRDNGIVLQAIMPFVLGANRESGELARTFYDEERIERLGERHDFYLDTIREDWAAEALAPILNDTNPAARDDDEAAVQSEKVLMTAVAIADQGGRRTMLGATETDRELAGWARVEGGAESCAFCTVLISRGPVYRSADSAGLDADDESAKELAEDYARTGNRAELDSLMKRFHLRCDCQVVPVFDRDDWPGRDQFIEAEQKFIAASKAAKEAGADPMTALRYQLDGKPVPNKKDKK